ncbi:MAG: hypothetical protein Q3983_10355, partial [Capnocytophaga sp.]|nr:hypothetical protein [Capnocytophaga sp.]
RLKREDYPALGNIVLVSLKRDIKDFTKEYKTINEEFIKELEDKVNNLKKMVSYNVLQSNQKSHTKILYEKANILKDRASLLKQYAIKAKLDTSLIAKNIKNINAKNIEGVVQSFRDIIHYYSQNKEKLTAMPDNFLEDLTEKNNEIEKLNIEQKHLMSSSKGTVQNNKKVYDELYTMIKEVISVGKIIYKNSVKKEEYTMSKILDKLRTKTKGIENKEENKEKPTTEVSV